MTQAHRAVQVGASPRGSLALMLIARAYAVVHGRDHIAPEDVRAVAHVALDDRISIEPELWMSELTGPWVVEAVLHEVPVPSAREAGAAPGGASLGALARP